MSGNFLSNFKISVVYASTAAGVGTTGDTSFGSGSTIPPTTTIGTGFPFNSTSLDTAGYTEVTFIATAPDSTSLRLAVGWANSSGTGTTSYTHFTGGSIESTGSGAPGYSTGATAVAINVVKPVKRWIQATAYVPTTSACLVSIIAVQSRPDKVPVAAYSTAYKFMNAVTIGGSTA